jgi:hypothetical protein
MSHETQGDEMTHPYATPPIPPAPRPDRPAPRWARKRYVLPALALAFFIGAAIGTSGQDTKKTTTTDAKPAAARPQPTMTVTATTTETATPAPAPTVTTTKTVKVTKTVTAEAAAGSGSGSVSGSGGGSTYYTNCTAARAAGVTPLYRGDPGYDSHLDRDGDGVACE